MNRIAPLVVLALASLSTSVSLAEDKIAAIEEIFTRQVQPLLKAKCLGCHGQDPKLRGGLDLRSRETMLKGGDTGPALIPGNAARSLLYQSVLRTGALV